MFQGLSRGTPEMQFRLNAYLWSGCFWAHSHGCWQALVTHHMDHFTGLPKTCQLPSLRACDPWDHERDYIQDEGQSFYNLNSKVSFHHLWHIPLSPTTLKEKGLPKVMSPQKWRPLGPIQGCLMCVSQGFCINTSFQSAANICQVLTLYTWSLILTMTW